MAKLALINREAKRRKMVEKFKIKRAALDAVIHDNSHSEEERDNARLKLQNLPRNSSSVRLLISIFKTAAFLFIISSIIFGPSS